MELRSYQPATCLAPYVERYWHTTDEHVEGIWRQEWLPPVMHCLIFNRLQNIRTVTAGRGETVHPDSFFLGNLTEPGYNIVEGKLDVFAVHFKPTAIHRLFGLSMRHAVDRQIAFCDVENKRKADEITRRMVEAPSPAEAVAVIDSYLIKKMLHCRPRYKAEALDPIVRLLISHKGNYRINDLVRETHYSPKTLERHFAELVGPSPRQFLSIVRFNAALDYLHRVQSLSPSTLTQTLGYFDYSHFSRDCIKLAHKAPHEIFPQYSDFDKFFMGV